MLGTAISDITEAAAKLAPDIAPKIPQAKTVPIATPPRIFEVQLYAALYMSVASPPEEVRKAMRMNIGTADKTYEATASNVTSPTILISTFKSPVSKKIPIIPAVPREKAMGIPKIKNINRAAKGSNKSIGFSPEYFQYSHANGLFRRLLFKET
jgi:hypothetical protein